MNAAIADVLRYNRWATLTLLEACRPLTDEQLDARPPGVSGSVRELLVHLVGGQQTQVLRTKGRHHEGELSRRSAWPGIDVLIEAAATSSDELIAIAEAVDGVEEVDLPYLGKTYRFPKHFFVTHAIEHGVEHRTEIKVALGSMGIDTPDLDGWSYSAAAGYGQDVG